MMVKTVMVQNKADEFLKIFSSFLPEDLRASKKDLERNFKAAINAAFTRMNLVTREEYDIQTELLSRTRSIVAELEQKVAQMEQQLSIRAEKK